MKLALNQISILGILITLFFVSCSKDKSISDEPPTEAGYNWAATADSMQLATYNSYLGTEGTFVQDNAGSTNFNYWPNAHVLHTLVDGYERTKDASYIPKMKSLLLGIKSKNGNTFSNVFNDDMLWLGNACVRAYLVTNDIDYKEAAEFLWEDIILSYSEVFGGGITWKKDTPNEKNAVSNGPAIILAMRLYDLDKEERYLNWAKDLYEWQKANLVDPQSGLVWDNIKITNGQVSTNKDWVFTYNVGTWIGAGLRLFQVTNEQVYLDDALKTAKSTMESTKLTTDGVMRNEGQGDGGLFKGILARYFTELALSKNINASDQELFVSYMQFNAVTLHDKGLIRPFMLAGPDWSKKPFGVTIDLTTQLSGLMLIEAAAKLDNANLFN
tara:strand:+ start:63001 stop:64155 length:1155 start_codon:yes stop_codon:yes gene_type:complete